MIPADYTRLLDDEMQAYVARSERYYPPDAVGLSVAAQRDVYDAMCAAFRQERPAGVRTRDEDHGGVLCRRYESGGASDVTVIYFHGGGFVVGGLDSHDDVCAEICAATGYRVVAVDYALAPEHVFPACFNDAWAAAAAIATHWRDRIVLAGDSAGGNLAAAVAHRARRDMPGRIAGQMLIYPGLGGDDTRGSYITHAQAPQLTVADLGFYKAIRAGSKDAPDGDPRFAPLHDVDFTGLPPSVVITAQCDPLSSDGQAYRDALRAAGGQAAWLEEPGLVHGYLRARVMSARARDSFDRIVAAIAALGRGDWPALPG